MSIREAFRSRNARIIGTLLAAYASIKPVVEVFRWGLDVIGEGQTLRDIWPSIKSVGLVAYNLPPIWLNFILMAMGGFLLYSSRSSVGKTTSEDAMLGQTYLEPRVAESDTSITYKAKFVANFANLIGRRVHFRAPYWQSLPNDAGVQTPFWCRYRYQADGQWREDPDAHIDPKGDFRIVLGLDKACSHDELENRRRERRLGTLLIPIEVKTKFRTKLRTLKYRV